MKVAHRRSARFKRSTMWRCYEKMCTVWGTENEGRMIDSSKAGWLRSILTRR